HLLVQPFIAIYPENNQPSYTIAAETAELMADPRQGLLRMRLENASVQRGDDSYGFTEPHEFAIPLTDVHRKGGPVKRAADCALNQIGVQRRQEQDQLSVLRRQLAAQAALQLATGSLEAIDAPTWWKELEHLESSRDRVNRLTVEPWRRWANGFSCFFFVL